MEYGISPDNVRSRLLFSGLRELEAHGVTDFSLRRVAQDAGVSCAAPYRHFKDKDELIASVIGFVLEGWTILCSSIAEIFSDDSKARLTELSVSGFRFWIANGNFKTVITACSSSVTDEGPLSDFNKPIISAARDYANESGMLDSDRLAFKILSMIYGAVMLVDGGCESADTAADNLRYYLENAL